MRISMEMHEPKGNNWEEILDLSHDNLIEVMIHKFA
jgi:hypothetical protein